MWLDRGVASRVTVVSIAGGERDLMVPAHLTQTNYSINVAVSTAEFTFYILVAPSPFGQGWSPRGRVEKTLVVKQLVEFEHGNFNLVHSQINILVSSLQQTSYPQLKL